MKLAYKNSKRAWFYCWFHNDTKRPNLSITLEEPYYGRYRCWACGRSGVFTSRQLSKMGLNKMKKEEHTNEDLDWNSLVKEYQSNLFTTLLLNLRPLDMDFRAFGMGWDGEAYTFPMFNALGECTGIQRRFIDGNKGMVPGSKLGLFIPTNLLYEKTLFITEGISDACAVYDLGFEVIGRASCNTCVEILYDFISFEPEIKRVIVIPDNDEVGLEGCHNLEIGIDNKCFVAINHFSYSGAKDIREYIIKVGKERVRDELRAYL